MEDVKINGARQAVQNMLFYYLTSLIGKVKDPKQHIATEIAEMIDLSEDQALFVYTNVSTDNKLIESLTSSIDLLTAMENNKQYDEHTIHIVKGMLTVIKQEGEKVLKGFTIKDEIDG